MKEIFFALILYTATLPDSLMSSSSFLIESLGFSMYSITSSANSDSCTSCILIWLPFTSSSSLIAVARTSNTVLNKSHESGHPCLVPDPRGNVFSMLKAVGLMLAYMAFIMLRYIASCFMR